MLSIAKCTIRHVWQYIKSIFFFDGNDLIIYRCQYVMEGIIANTLMQTTHLCDLSFASCFVA